MKTLSIAYILGGACFALSLVFFGIIDLAPSTLRITAISQTAAAQSSIPEEAADATTSAEMETAPTSPLQKPASFPSGIVSINFDDGWKSAFTTGFPILKAAQMPATFYIISTYFGKPAYITVPDMLALQSAGEEIGDHTETHPNLTKLSPAQMQVEIAGSMAALESDGAQSITTFAYPYGASDAQTDAVVRASGYAAARTIDNGTDSPRSNPYHLLAREVTEKTSVAQVEQWIDAANARKQWLILVFHQLNPAVLPNDLYSWPTSNFQTIIDYLAANHLTVMTTAAVIDAYYRR
jgi:peptidoglycan/xylan/chitin deacetylase (PgdA/CDA1 family)